MAFETIDAPRHAAAGGFFANLAARISRYRMYLRTCRELEQMSERSLEDLGVSRDQIGELAYRTVYGR